jgi:hypothetical protein
MRLHLRLRMTLYKHVLCKPWKKRGVDQPEQLIELKCHNKGIQSVSGIEKLVNIESLSLFGNRIS